MGFNGRARRGAAAQQQAAYAQQQAAFQHAQQQNTEYQNNFNTRNASIIDIRNRGTQFLSRYNRGTDVSELIPASIKTGQQAADTTRATVQAMGRMGDASQLPNDSGYQSKLNSIMGARLGRGLAAVNEAALQGEVGNQTQNVFNASQFLNQDSQVGLNLNNQTFDMTNTIWQNAFSRRQFEQQVAQQSFSNLMSGIQAGVGVASGFFGAGGIMSHIGGSGATSGAGGHIGGGFQGIFHNQH